MHQYDYEMHVPKILPCQHTFCLSCLISIGANTIDIACPVCRQKHDVPSRGFTTNMLVLEVVEELLKDSASVLRCSKHTSRESVVVCIDCLDGLCMKCMKDTRKTSNPHINHHLEELADAKSQLWPKFEGQVNAKHISVQQKLSSLNQSAYSVAEITKVESDITKMCNKLDAAIVQWKDVQLAKVAEYKAEATEYEDKIHSQVTKLQSFLRKEDVNIVTLITELKRETSLWDQSPDLNDYFDRNEYNLTKRCNELSQKLHSELCSQESITSKLLQEKSASVQEEELDAQSNVVHSQQTIRFGSITDEIDLGALILGYIVFVFLPVLVSYLLLKGTNSERIRNRDRAKEILFQVKPNFRRIFIKHEQTIKDFMNVCIFICVLFWKCPIASGLLVTSITFICLNKGYSDYIIMFGWVAFELTPLKVAEKITLVLGQIEQRRSKLCRCCMG